MSRVRRVLHHVIENQTFAIKSYELDCVWAIHYGYFYCRGRMYHTYPCYQSFDLIANAMGGVRHRKLDVSLPYDSRSALPLAYTEEILPEGEAQTSNP